MSALNEQCVCDGGQTKAQKRANVDDDVHAVFGRWSSKSAQSARLADGKQWQTITNENQRKPRSRWATDCITDVWSAGGK
jgi:hypothetical protein